MSLSRMKEVTCDVCEKGILKAYQLNFEEAVFLCTSELCLGHLNKPDFSSYIVKRKLLDIDTELEPPKKKQKPDIAASIESENSLDNFLDELLMQPDVLDQNYDIGDILFDDVVGCFSEDPSDAVPLLERNEQNLSGNLVKGSSSQNTDNLNNVGLSEPCLPVVDLQSNVRKGEIAELTKTKNDLKIASKSNGAVRNIVRKKKSIQPIVSEVLNSPTVAASEVCTKCDFMEACLCLLLSNRNVHRLKVGRTNIVAKLLDYCRKREIKTKSNFKIQPAESVRKDFVSILHMKRSKWQPDQTLPIYVIPELLKCCPPLKDLFWLTYRWEVSCVVCSNKASAVEETAILTLKKVPIDFTMTKAYCFVQCPHCGSDNQKKFIAYYVLPNVVAAHFTCGFPYPDVCALDFFFQGNAYKVTQVIQQQDEKRFFTWSRNLDDDLWYQHNNIESQPLYGVPTLDLKASEYHLIVWEKQDCGKHQDRSVTVKNPHTASTLSRSLPNSPCVPRVPIVPLKSGTNSLKAAVDRRSLSECNPHSPFSAWPKCSAPSRLNAGDPAFRSHDSDIDASVASPSSSEVSNSSDGDATIVSSLFRAPIKSSRTVTKTSSVQWKEETLDEHQKKWTEWRFQAQNPQIKKSPKKRNRRPNKKQTKTAAGNSCAIVPTCSTNVKRVPVNLLDGIDIFLK